MDVKEAPGGIAVSLWLARVDVKIIHGQIMILEKLVVGPLASNCYIIGSETSRAGAVIDPGDDARQILAGINELELDIKYILLTHGHLDHTGALKEVKESTGASVAVHSADVKNLNDDYLSLFTGISYPKPPPPDRLLEDGDTIDIGDFSLTVVHTPGHSPGGICLLGGGILFSGDTLFNFGIGRADLPGGNSRQLMESIHKRLLKLPDEIKVYPGHGPDTTIGAERRSNPFLI
ncbi:MAG: MBL fold metallo-hydrolase [Dehalococcoidales bacterium]|nr:MBL fold metallo-hydrolase [Dehalococcoidales bacterium]